MTEEMTHWLALILRWAARLTGAVLLLLVLAIAVGHGGPPNPFRQPLPAAIELWLMLVMTLGLVAAWRWELAGALATLVALAAFNAVELSVNGKHAGGAFPLFAIPPVLYLLHATLRRHHRPRDLAQGQLK